MKSNSIIYSGKEAKILSAIAVIMMIHHHLFAYSGWWLPQVEVRSTLIPAFDKINWLISRLGNFCVFIFAFQSGYSLYIGRSQSYRHRIIKLFRFCLVYWSICLLFWTVGFIQGDTLPSINEAIQNMIGLGTSALNSYVNVCFAWYVFYYIIFIILSSFWLKLFSHKYNFDCLEVILASAFLMAIYCFANRYYIYLCPLLSSIAGIIFAKYNLLSKVNNHLFKYRIMPYIGLLVVFLLVMSGVGLIKYYQLNNTPVLILFWAFYGVLSGVFIVCILNIYSKINIPILDRLLVGIGKLSMIMWFVHSLIYTGSKFLQPIVYFHQEPILIFITALIITITISCIINITIVRCIIDRFPILNKNKY